MVLCRVHVSHSTGPVKRQLLGRSRLHVFVQTLKSVNVRMCLCKFIGVERKSLVWFGRLLVELAESGRHFGPI
jgi:hypothetical protein